MRDRKQGDETDDAPEYSDQESEPVVFTHFDWERTDSPSVAVAEAVAAVTNRTVTALPPLQHAVDADALDAMVGSGDGPVRVTFDYADVTVTVADGGRVEIVD